MDIIELQKIKDAFKKKRVPQYEVLVCGGTGCMSSESKAIADLLKQKCEEQQIDARVRQTGCFGFCEQGPIVKISSRIDDNTFLSREGSEPLLSPVDSKEGSNSTIVDLGDNGLVKNPMIFDTRQRASMALPSPCADKSLLAMTDTGDDTFYVRVQLKDVERIIEGHLKNGEIIEDLLYKDPQTGGHEADQKNIKFYSKQRRIALQNCGIIDPEDIREAIANDAYFALAKCLLELKPGEIIEVVKASGLRGRGGGGFPTGLKWELTAKEKGRVQNDDNIILSREDLGRRFDSASLEKITLSSEGKLGSEQTNHQRGVASKDTSVKYVVCNADEGDPGAFMDRSLLEGDPHAIIEAMAICGRAIGANAGIVYIRAEYPLAVQRLEIALKQARELGLLGENILGSGFDFDIRINLGAGAFVCGEETSLMNSVQGERGEPRIKPPFPAQSGVWGMPTNINNVETYGNIPKIILNGAEWFASIGTEKSKGTKVFALAGKINNVGLTEIPMGTTLRDVIYDIGGGIRGGKALKAVQTGGPSGGCIPAEMLDMPIDYESLQGIGSMMGSGGMIVMDETDCMVDVAKFFLEFTVDESCGKCTPCRIGNLRMLEILERITKGEGKEEDLDTLIRLGEIIKDTSLCGLGQSSPNPVLSTIKYFRHEYEAHIRDGKCPAGRCTSLFRFMIDVEKCKACTVCAKNCPVDCIEGERGVVHKIRQEDCIKCGTCEGKCPFGAIGRQ